MENMEFFAVTNVAKAFKTRSRGVFCATNFCNENAHADFMKNHENAKKELEIYLKNNLFFSMSIFFYKQLCHITYMNLF